MPRRQKHLDAAVIPGLAAGLYFGRTLTGGPFVAHLLGSVLAARFGAVLPDLLEPALHPRHRKLWHSRLVLLANGRVTLSPPALLIGWRSALLAEARDCKRQREALSAQHPDRTGLWLSEMVCYFLAGCIIGLPIGYCLHLLQDAGTSSGLPLIS